VSIWRGSKDSPTAFANERHCLLDAYCSPASSGAAAFRSRAVPAAPGTRVAKWRHNDVMRVHPVELFRHHFSLSEEVRVRPDAAVRSVVEENVALLEDGVTHIGVATHHVAESFRNEL
jgi:hypothetical protein